MSYSYHGKTYRNLFELGKDIYLFQDSFSKDLKNDASFQEKIKSEDENKYLRLKKLFRMSFPDSILSFRASLILNPYIEFSYRGLRFHSDKELGEYLLRKAPEADPIGLEIIHYNLLSLYMLFTHVATTDHEKYETICGIEKLAENDINYSYFVLALYLSRRKTFRYDGKEYKDIYSLLYYLKKEKKDEALLANELRHSPYLKAYGRFSKDKEGVESFLHLNREYDRSEEKLSAFLKKREESIKKAKESIQNGNLKEEHTP